MRVAVVLVLFLAAPAFAEDAGGRVVAQIESIRNGSGKVGCMIYGSAPGFPTDPTKAMQKSWTEIHDGKAVCEFAGISSGTYAIAVIHDENNNGTLDTNFMGIPKEGVGVSNDAKGFMGPPKFDKAKFTYAGGVLNLVIHMKYL